ncbi:MAG: S8 family serine peptidase [Candidatus Sericytochromatia bacterium]
MLKKSVAWITVSCFIVSCNIFTNNNSTTGGTLRNVAVGKFNIKSTTNPNEIKKNFLPVTRINKQKGKEREKDDNKKRVFTFNASQDDLKRSFILNITNGAGGGERVGNLEVFINGTQVIFNHDEDIDNTDDINKIKKKLCKDDSDDRDGKDSGKKDDDKKFKIKHDEHDKNKPSCELLISNFFNKKTDALSVGLPSIKEGVNSLEVRVKDERDKFALDISIDGFLKAFNLPKAVHSIISDDENTRKMLYQKGIIKIKFTEGLKTRLVNNEIIDLTGSNFSSLKNIFKLYKVSQISKNFIDTPEELDAREIKAEMNLKKDVPNLNLFFTLKVNENTDIWQMRDELKKLPFIEEAQPEFYSSVPIDNYTPTDPALQGIIPDAYWLQTIKVMDKGLEKGAWSLLNDISFQTNKDIRGGNLKSFPENTRNDNKIAIIGGGIFHKNLTNGVTHEDLDDIKINVYDYGNNNNIGFSATHDTKVIGITSATENNGKGLAGIAYGVNIDYFRAVDSQCKDLLSNKKPVLERNVKCNEGGYGLPAKEERQIFSLGSAVENSIEYANKNGAKVILIELNNQTKTTEQSDFSIRSAIVDAVSNGSTVIVPAGNSLDTDISKITVNCTSSTNRDICDTRTGVSETFPMPDTGSIIVGGLTSDGKNLLKNNKYYNYGKTNFGISESSYDYSPDTGHGIDISAPADNIYTTSYGSNNNPIPTPKDYAIVQGTSFSSPMIASIISLAYTIAPEPGPLHPLTMRDLIRITANNAFTGVITDNRTTAGCVNAYEFLKRFIKLVNDKNFVQVNGKSIFEDRFGKPFSISSVEEPPQPISEQIKEELSKIQITLNGKSYTLLEIVQNYADFTLDPAFFQNNTLTEDVRIKIQNTLNTITGNTFAFSTIHDTLKTAVIQTKINTNIDNILYYTNNTNGYFALKMITPDGTFVDDLAIDPITKANDNVMGWTINKFKTQVAAFSNAHNSLVVYDLDSQGNLPLQKSKRFYNTKLSTSHYFYNSIRFSHDGKKLAYISDNDNTNGHAFSAIYILDLETGLEKKANNFNYYGNTLFFNWSEDDSKLVYELDTGRFDTEIYVINTDGTNNTTITNNGYGSNTGTYSSNPIFTKDGTRVIYIFDGDLYSAKIDGTDKKQLTNMSRTVPVIALDWSNYLGEIKISSDGSKIAFTVQYPTGRELCIMNVDGTGFQKITTNPDTTNSYGVGYYSWSALENKIAYQSINVNIGGYIYTINADGTNNKKIIDVLGAWTPEWGIKSVKNSSKNEINLSW